MIFESNNEYFYGFDAIIKSMEAEKEFQLRSDSEEAVQRGVLRDKHAGEEVPQGGEAVRLPVFCEVSLWGSEDLL